MRLRKKFSIWWGPPKDFTTEKQDRRVSWLELFYDLVYVIAIARISEHLSHDISFHGFIENICLFVLIFWGWLNGSLHHDLHGNQGLRTRLMTLWQMMIIAALAIVLDKTHEGYTGVITIFMLMQLFITYQWWSVGIYDKSHRKYSSPYTISFLISFGLMGLSLLVSSDWLWIIYPLVIVFNYIPPFISNRLLRRSAKSLDLSTSMFERLGLFTIIVFGELVIGVVNGMSRIEIVGTMDWIHFALGISVVFSLWWIFFTLVSRREAKKGFDKASLLELLYIPALISLGFIAASFHSLFQESEHTKDLQQLFGFSIAVFLCCISLIMGLLAYPQVFDTLKRPMRLSLLLTMIVFLIVVFLNLPLSITGYLLLIECILIVEIAYLNYIYYSKLLKEGIDPLDV